MGSVHSCENYLGFRRKRDFLRWGSGLMFEGTPTISATCSTHVWVLILILLIIVSFSRETELFIMNSGERRN